MNEDCEYDPLVAQQMADRSDNAFLKVMVKGFNRELAEYLANPWWKAKQSAETIKVRVYKGPLEALHEHRDS